MASSRCTSRVDACGNFDEHRESRVVSPSHRAIYLTGPTASGKTAVGVALAKKIDAEIVAMDSMTLYRGMDVGTAKPTWEERAGIPHHLIDVIDVWESASVADFRDLALAVIADIEARGRRVLFVGGTALYLKAMMRGLFEGPGADPAIRETLEDDAARMGDLAFHARLAEVDPVTASRLPPGDRRRVVRALEVYALTGSPLSSLQTGHDLPVEGLRVFAIDRLRDQLHHRINVRVEQMFRQGLLEEVRRLQDAPRPMHHVPSQGVGYREAIAHLAGKLSRDAMIASTQARTRQFAKRQCTWFRGLKECRIWPVPEGESAEFTAEQMAREILRAE